MVKPRPQFEKTRNFMIFYGYGEGEHLSRYDTVILEPKGHSKAEIAFLKSKGIIVLAYLSIVELPPWHRAKTILKPEDFLESEGLQYVNPLDGNALVKIGSARWQRYLFHEAGLLILHQGYDGLFLDTVGWVEHPVVLRQYGQSQIFAMVSFFMELRSRFHDAILIQNNALEHLGPRTVELMDGFCWENPILKGEKSQLWNEEILDRLKNWRHKNRKQILLVCEASDLPADDINTTLTTAQLAEKYDFLFCHAGQKYLNFP